MHQFRIGFFIGGNGGKDMIWRRQADGESVGRGGKRIEAI